MERGDRQAPRPDRPLPGRRRRDRAVRYARGAPPLPFIPERLHGVPVVTIVACWAGPIERGERVLEPLRRHGRPLLDLIAPKPYLAHQGSFDATVPHGLHYHWRSEYLDALDDPAIATLLAHAFRSRSPRSYTIMFQLGGAVGRVADDATAFSGRSAGFAVNVNGVALPQEYAEQAAWVRGFGQALRPLSAGVFMNFLDDEGQDRVRAAYGPAKHARLVALRDAWDPENFFRCNQNIHPSAELAFPLLLHRPRGERHAAIFSGAGGDAPVLRPVVGQ